MSDIIPLEVGQVTTTNALDSELGKITEIDGKLYRFVKNTSSVSNAGGKALVFSFTLGVPSWGVAETTTAANFRFAGVVPSVYGLATTLAADARLLVQFSGPAIIKSDTLVAAGSALITDTLAGSVKGIATGTEASTSIPAYIGYATNTAVATGVAAGITCVLMRPA